MQPEKSSQWVAYLEAELDRSQFRMPAGLYRTAKPLVDELKRCQWSTEVAARGIVALSVLHHEYNSTGTKIVSVGPGYSIYVDGYPMGQTDAAGQATLSLPVGKRLLRVRKPPNEAWSSLVDVQNNEAHQVSMTLADDKQVYPPCSIRINNSEDLVLPIPPAPVELSLWLEDTKIPLVEILSVTLEREQGDVRLDVTEDFVLVDSIAKLTQPARIREFLAAAEGKVTLSFSALDAGDSIYSENVAVWPSEGSVVLEERRSERLPEPAGKPPFQIRIVHTESGIIHYLPEGAISSAPVRMPRGEVLIEGGRGGKFSLLTAINVRGTATVSLDASSM